MGGGVACGIAGAVLALLAGCDQPRTCTLVAHVPSVAVDIGSLDVDARGTDARLCLDGECEDVPVLVIVSEPLPPGASPSPMPDLPPMVRWERPIPERDRVEVTLVLTDRDSGAEVYRGTGQAVPDVWEPNGEGCGEVVSLPPLTAEPDGSLTT